MATRIITGVLRHADGSPLTEAMVRFAMVNGSYTVVPGITYPQEQQAAITDTNGAFTITLTSGLGIWMDCHLPDGDGFRFPLNDGVAVTLATLRAETGVPMPVSYPGSEIVITAPHQGQILRHNGTQFVNVDWPTISVTDYGAVGDGVADDTEAIQNAINAASAAGGGIVFLPHGNYRITSTLFVTGAVSLQGVGTSAQNLDSGGTLTSTTYGSVITAGAAMGDMIEAHQVRGASWTSFALDGSNLAVNGIYGDRFRYCTLQNLRMSRFTVYCLHLLSESNNTSDDCNFNTFSNLTLDRAPTPLILEGNGLNTANVCHNTFVQTYVDFTGGGSTPGVYIGFSDNNVFTQLYGYNRGGSTIGITIGTRSTNNYFYDCELRPYVETPLHPQSSSYMVYDRSNGQLPPLFQTYGKGLDWIEIGQNSSGWHPRLLVLDNAPTETTVLDACSTANHHYIDARLIRNSLSPIDRSVRIGWNSGPGGEVSLWANTEQLLRVLPSFVMIDGSLALKEGLSPPVGAAGYACLYMDGGDGDLHIRFADGTTKTVVTNP